jgi:ABC-type lipoprotein export system ATPase subunit
MNTPALQVTSLAIAYTDTEGEHLDVVSGVSFSVVPGQLCCIAGRSGSGKTSVARVLVGLTAPAGGTVTWGGVDLSTLTEVERSDQRRKITGYVDQEATLIPGLTVLDNILLPAIPDGRDAARRAKNKAAEDLRRLGLERRRKWSPARLSGGERQRVALARALTANTPAIVVDEPTASLDRRWADTVIDLLLEHADAGGIVVAASHDPTLARASHTVITLDDASE